MLQVIVMALLIGFAIILVGDSNHAIRALAVQIHLNDVPDDSAKSSAFPRTAWQRKNRNL